MKRAALGRVRLPGSRRMFVYSLTRRKCANCTNCFTAGKNTTHFRRNWQRIVQKMHSQAFATSIEVVELWRSRYRLAETDSSGGCRETRRDTGVG